MDNEKTVGAILKEARLAKGISLADAEKGTSIRSRYLQAVENDEYDKTPGEVFLKGIIRNYGNFLGLNVRSLLMNTRPALPVWQQRLYAVRGFARWIRFASISS